MVDSIVMCFPLLPQRSKITSIFIFIFFLICFYLFLLGLRPSLYLWFHLLAIRNQDTYMDEFVIFLFRISALIFCQFIKIGKQRTRLIFSRLQLWRMSQIQRLLYNFSYYYYYYFSEKSWTFVCFFILYYLHFEYEFLLH